MDFITFWDTYNPDVEFANRRAATELEWNKCSPEKRQAIMQWLQEHRPPKGRNPYFFVLDFTVRRQILSFDAYYAQFGTTEEQNGWRRVFIKEQQKTVFVKE